MEIGDLGVPGQRNLTVQASGGDSVARIFSDVHKARLELGDDSETFTLEKSAEVIMLDATAHVSSNIQLNPGANGHLSVATDRMVIAIATGDTDILGDVSIGNMLNSTGSGARSMHSVSTTGGGEFHLDVDATTVLRLDAAGDSDSATLSFGGGADRFDISKLGSGLQLVAATATGSIEAVPGAQGRFGVLASGVLGVELLAVNGSTGDTYVAGNVEVGGPSAAGSRRLTMASGDSESVLSVVSGGATAAAGMVFGDSTREVSMMLNASRWTLSADDGGVGAVSIRSATDIGISSGGDVSFDNDIYVRNAIGSDSLLSVMRANATASAKIRLGATTPEHVTEVDRVFELSADSTTLSITADTTEGIRISNDTVELFAGHSGSVQTRSDTIVQPDGDATLTIFSKPPLHTTTSSAAMLKFDLNTDYTANGCTCRFPFDYTPANATEWGNDTTTYNGHECVDGPNEYSNSSTDGAWCETDVGCGTEVREYNTYSNDWDFSLAPVSFSTRDDLDGLIGFEFLVDADTLIRELGRSLPPSGALVTDTLVQLWHTVSRTVVAQVTVNSDSKVVDGFAYENLTSLVYAPAGQRYRLTISTSSSDAGDPWYAHDGTTDPMQFNESTVTITTGVYGDGYGYPRDT